MQADFHALSITGTALAMTPSHFYVASSDEGISIIDRVTQVVGEVLKHLPCHVLHLAVTANSSHLVAVNKNGFFLWDLQTHDPNPTLTDQADDYDIKEASSNGSLVATLHQPPSPASSFVLIKNCSDLSRVRKIEDRNPCCLDLGATTLLCGTRRAIISYPLQQEGSLTNRSANTSSHVTRCWTSPEKQVYFMEKNHTICVLSKKLMLLWTYPLSSYKAIVGVTPHALILQDPTQLCYLPFQEIIEKEADETPPHFYPFDGAPPHLCIESIGEPKLDRIFVLSKPESFEVVDAPSDEPSEATAGFLLHESHEHLPKRIPVAAPRHQTKICGALVAALEDEPAAAPVITGDSEAASFVLLSDAPDTLVVAADAADPILRSADLQGESTTSSVQDQQATAAAVGDESFVLLEVEKEPVAVLVEPDEDL